MGSQFYQSDNSSSNKFEKNNSFLRNNLNTNASDTSNRDKDDDLIIEENTVYEIDRECYNRLRKQRKRKI